MKKTLIVLMALSGIALGETAPKTVADAAYSITNATTSNSTLDFSSDSKAYNAATLSFKLNVDNFLNELYAAGQNHTNASLATYKSTSSNLGLGIRYNSSSNTLSSIYAVYSSETAAAGANGTGMSTGYGPGSWTTTLNGVPTDNTSTFSNMLTAWGYNTTTHTNNVSDIVCSMAYAAGSSGGHCYMTVVMDNGDCYEFSGATTTSYKFSYTDVTNLSVNSALVSDAYLFDSVLSSADVTSVHSSMMVPEPTTATLSLLALAGLAARRRRR